MGDYKQNAATRLWQRFTEMYGARFLESFGAKPTDSWVDAMGDLSAQQVKGALAKIRNSGSAHPPSLPEFIGMAKGVMPEVVRSSAPKIHMSPIASYGNRTLLAFVQSRGACSAESMTKLVHEKNRLCDAYEIICQDEPDACQELRDKLIKVFESVWEQISDAERAEGIVRFNTHRPAPDMVQPRTPDRLPPQRQQPAITAIGELMQQSGSWAAESPFPSEFV